MTKEEVSERYCIPISILNEYHDMGLCDAVRMAMDDWHYDDEDLERLSMIMALHDMGFQKEKVESYMKLLIRFFYRNKPFFKFDGFEEPKSRDTAPNIIVRYLKNLGRNVKATGLYFLFGIILSALFQRYVPADAMTSLFGGNEAFGVLMAATIGVPLYACGGGTIPILQQWLWDVMPMGSAAAFMITGPATKITNLGALKIVLGIKRFIIYIAFVMWFALTTGLIVNLIV